MATGLQRHSSAPDFESAERMCVEEDYSLYGSLSEDEQICLAIEQSLQELAGRGSPPHKPGAAPVLAVTGRSHTPAAPTHRPVAANDVASSSQIPLRRTFLNAEGKKTGGRKIHAITGRTLKLQIYKQASGSERSTNPVALAIENDDVSMLQRIIVTGTDLSKVQGPDTVHPVHAAAFLNKPRCLRLLLQKYPQLVNLRSRNNETPLTLASGTCNLECMKVLLGMGASPDVCQSYKETPLHQACECANIEAASLLIKFNANVNFRGNHGHTPLYEAISKNNLDMVILLMSAGAKMNVVNDYGVSPHFVAAECGHLAILRHLVSLGADIDTEARNGATALYEATKNNHGDVVEFLLSVGANANKPTKEGLLPLHIAASNGNEEIVCLLLPGTKKARIKRCGISPLHLAAKNGHYDVLQILINSGFDVNFQLSDDHSFFYEDRRTTALYFAVAATDVDCAELLLESSADPNLDPINPLLVAIRLHAHPLVGLLLAHGADVNACVATHPTAFPAAVMFSLQDLRTLELVLRHGASGEACFRCPFGGGKHPPVPPKRRNSDDTWVNAQPRVVHFCELLVSDELESWAGPIVDVLLNFVTDVRLCSRIKEQLDSYHEWSPIIEMAENPRPLSHLCRMTIRSLFKSQRMRLIDSLPLPKRLRDYLLHKSGEED
ncbi:unnamed protein product [Lampetra planeri]